MSGSDEKKDSVDSTLDDLRSVDTDPLLERVGPTMTLDEVPERSPGDTQLLSPVEDDVPTDPRVRIPAAALSLGESGEAPSTLPRRRAPLKSDAFESAPQLLPARSVEPRGPPPAWEKSSAWTPMVVVLAAIGVALVLVSLFVILRS